MLHFPSAPRAVPVFDALNGQTAELPRGSSCFTDIADLGNPLCSELPQLFCTKRLKTGRIALLFSESPGGSAWPLRLTKRLGVRPGAAAISRRLCHRFQVVCGRGVPKRAYRASWGLPVGFLLPILSRFLAFTEALRHRSEQ